ncbi:hypothetical protein BC936DRAFT_137308 [Jimgerdemannia flammicorona]|uniref:Uncharacterized protein n=1 Tax=Jimgerdemannia flammicorona TaxID=994334 RepID=A0A433CXN8_9FUNG|nr:hypothetical protein BC936DRAFT_137308 [Jimgerdemannia flammicorona]
MAVTVNLGGKFYSPEERINRLYWAAIVATILTNMVFIGSLIIHNVTSYFNGIIFDHIARMCVPVVIIISFAYAFYPVVVIGTDVDHKPALVIAVGVWFLAGMFLLSVFYFIIMVISIAFPFQEYYQLNIIQTSVEALLRFAILDFYSTQPSTKIILTITKRLFPFLLQPSSNDDYPSDLRLGVALGQQDGQPPFVTSKSTMGEIV